MMAACNGNVLRLLLSTQQSTGLLRTGLPSIGAMVRPRAKLGAGGRAAG